LEKILAEADRQVRAIAGLAGEILLSDNAGKLDHAEDSRD
jgi:hypothetical protein